MSGFYGVDVNHEENRYEWNPSDLTENIFQILGTLNRRLFKAEGNVYKIGEGRYAINFRKPQRD